MKLPLSFFVMTALLTCTQAIAQNYDTSTLPKTKEEFVKSEPDFISAAKWLETTPLGTDNDKRKQMNAWVLAWLVNSPTVTVEVSGGLTKLFNKNNDLLGVFMAGYVRYCLENNYSKDKLKGTVAGVKSAINCYNLGGDIKKDKSLKNAIDADKNGTLEDWVKQVIMEAK